MVKVPMARRNKKSEVFPGNASDDNAEKKKALRPNAASGKAVAVPRWLGKFNAAIERLVCIETEL